MKIIAQNPLVSVIVPIYNVEKYVEKCVDSIVNQSYKNIEIILVNDGSTDKSRDIISQYQHDSRCSIIDKENGGLSSARNAGINMASGQYILFVDSDDWIDAGCIGTLVQHMSESQAYFCCYRYRFINSKNETTKTCNNFSVNSYVGTDIINNALSGHDITITAWSKFFKSDFIKDNKLCFREGIINEDYLFTIECSIKAEKVSFCNKLLYFAFERDNSISRNIKEENVLVLSTLYKEVLRLFDDAGLLKTFYQCIDASYSKLTLYTLVQTSFRSANYDVFIRLYNLLSDEPYMKYKVGSSIRIISCPLFLLYVLSMYPRLFYANMRLLKLMGVRMY